LPITAERGYIIPAINNEHTDYEACAHRLADSIREWHPDANITVMTAEQLPHGDLGGWANDWQVFHVSPYRETIKLEADMYCAGPIDHWWTLFENRDVVISRGCRDYYDRTATSRAYRRVFDENNLPDVYNAITYWRLSKTAKEFFGLVRSIFENWSQFRTLLRFPDDEPSTDLVYAMAVQIMGPDSVTLPPGFGPTIVHMKRKIIGTKTEDWTRELIWEFTRPGLRIGTVAQHGLVHYHVKDWLCR
jgi:hypothetical protein